MSGLSAKWLVGKIIAAVDLRKFYDGKGGQTTDPIIRFADGSEISFTVAETEVGEYGVEITYWSKKNRRASATQPQTISEGKDG